MIMGELSYLGLWLAVFSRALCLPMPAPLFLMTAGALSAHGHMHLGLSLFVSILGCLGGDGVWFWCGRRWGHRVTDLVWRFTSNPARSASRSKKLFKRWGLGLIIVAKFVPGLDGVTPPLAGAEGISYGRFIIADATGGFLWSLFYSLLGFLFADQLDRAAHIAKAFAFLIAIVFGLPLVFWIMWRSSAILMMIRHLRLRIMTPERLHEKMQRGDKVAIIDLLGIESRYGVEEGIPGSIRLSAQRLKYGPKIISVPEDVEIVLYCSSRQQILSARAALKLKRRGVHSVSVLEGGLEAWKKQGFRVSQEFASPDDLARALGIKLFSARRAP